MTNQNEQTNSTIFTSANEFFIETLKTLKEKGNLNTVRGNKVIELKDYSYTITDSRCKHISLLQRKFPKKGFLAETLWYMSENPSINVIKNYLPNWSKYSDNGLTVNSNYGYQWKDQIPYILELILDDPMTRQGTVTMYDKDFARKAALKETKDVICTPSFSFNCDKVDVIDDRKKWKDIYSVNISVSSRSRDIIWGEAGGDILSFSILLNLVVNQLNEYCMDRKINDKKFLIGSYTNHISNIHIYEPFFSFLDIKKEEWTIDYNYDYYDLPVVGSSFTDLCYMNFWDQLNSNFYTKNDFFANVNRLAIDREAFYQEYRDTKRELMLF